MNKNKERGEHFNVCCFLHLPFSFTYSFNEYILTEREYVAICLSCVWRKPVTGVPDQVRHKLGCTATEDG